MTEWLGVAAVFLAVTGGAFLLLGLARLLRRPAKPAGPDDLDENDEDRWSSDLAKHLQPGKGGLSSLQEALNAAGYYSPRALKEYLAIRWVLIVMPLMAGGFVALAVEPSYLASVVVGALMLGGLGYSLPRIFLSIKGRRRRREIIRALPAAVDLMTLGLSAGQTLTASLELAAAELKETHPALGEELAIAHRQAELHSLEYALLKWAERVPLSEVRTLALMVVQSERLGTDTSATLLEYAGNLRVAMRQQAEGRANQASFWMLAPSVCCLFVAALIVLIGPTYMEFWTFRKNSAEHLRQGKEHISQFGRQAPTGR